MTGRLPGLADTIATYLSDAIASGQLSKAASRAVRSTLTRFVAVVGQRPVASVKDAHVRRWLDGATDVSIETRRARLKHLRTYFRWAVAQGYAAEDPTAPIHIPLGRQRGLRQPAPLPPELDAGPLLAYAHDQRRRNLSPRTIDGNRRVLRSLALFVHPRPVLEADASDVQSWLDSCRLAAPARYTYLSAVRTFFDWALREEMVEANPARRLVPPRLPEAMARPIRDDDLRFALRCADARMRAWLLLGAYNGLRCVEMAGVRREDVLDDLDPPLLLVSRGKGGRQRRVPLHPAVEAALRLHGMPARGHVFTMEDGRPIRAETISCYIGRFLHSLGIRASAHQLRHWHGTELYALTRDLRLVQQDLGHANPSTTARYVGVSAAEAAAAVRALDVEAI